MRPNNDNNNNIGLLWHMLWLVVYNSSSVTRQWRIVTDSAANACYNYPQVPSFTKYTCKYTQNIHKLNKCEMTDSHILVASLLRSPVRYGISRVPTIPATFEITPRHSPQITTIWPKCNSGQLANVFRLWSSSITGTEEQQNTLRWNHPLIFLKLKLFGMM